MEWYNLSRKKMNVMLQDNEKGDLKMIYNSKNATALKSTWIRKNTIVKI